MKKRFSVEQITAVLQQAEQGVPIGDLCRKVAISEQTFYRWKKVYGGLQPSEARELKQLRDENTKLKRLVADLSLDNVMLQDVVQKSSEARQAAGSDALLDRALRDQPAAGVPGGAGDPLAGVLPEPEGSADCAAGADACGGADARPVRLSAVVGVAATGRLGGRERALLSRVHRGRPGVATEAPVAARDRRASGTATASRDAQRHLEYARQAMLPAAESL